MTNYKSNYRTSDSIVEVNYGGVKVLLTPDIKLVFLSNPAGATTETLHDWSTAANYQVPTGKKARIIYFMASQLNNAAADKVFYADDVDGTTNAVTLLQPAPTTTELGVVSQSIPAEKYINRTDTVSTQTISLILIEETA